MSGDSPFHVKILQSVHASILHSKYPANVCFLFLILQHLLNWYRSLIEPHTTLYACSIYGTIHMLLYVRYIKQITLSFDFSQSACVRNYTIMRNVTLICTAMEESFLNTAQILCWRFLQDNHKIVTSFLLTQNIYL